MNRLFGGRHGFGYKLRSVLFIFLILFSVLFFTLAVKAIMQPLSVSEKVVDNKIEQKLSSEYFAVVKPSTLYPDGGKIASGSTLFKNITKDLTFDFKFSIISEKPISIDAMQETIYVLQAENLWEREFILSKSAPVQTALVSDYTSDEKVSLKLSDVYSFIKSVEDETANRANYTLTVRQNITGSIYDEDKHMVSSINLELSMPFEVFSQYLKFAGESEENEYTITSVIESVRVVPQKFSLPGFSLSIVYSRIGFSIAAVIFISLLLLFMIISKKYAAEAPEDTGLIEKRNKRKIIPVTSRINMDAVTGISLDSLNDLLKIAEEKDEAVYKYSEAETSIYYVVNASFIYIFKSID
ncbi:MAG: DUF5305 family protein [Saccharofermentanales bacterium]